MKQLEIDPDFIVHTKLTGAAAVLKPVVYWDGTKYCCFLGINEKAGLLVFANKPKQAINEWNQELIRRLQIADEADYIIKHVQNAITNALRPEQLQKFL